MTDLIVSLNDNTLKLSFVYQGSFKALDKAISTDIVADSIINDVDKFIDELNKGVDEISAGKRLKFRLNFIIEPTDLVFRFVTLGKSEEDLDSRITKEVSEKLEGITLDQLYYSYVKIAPFVYQFVGVPKELLNMYLDISTKLGMELHTVMPWVLLLPKYVGSNVSAIFACKTGLTPVVVLSELGGVFFVGNYNENKSPDDLAKLISELSVYKRVKPIEHVYTFNFSEFPGAKGLNVSAIELPNIGTEETLGYEVNLLGHYMLDLVPDIPMNQTNLLTMLPVPVVQPKQGSVVPVGAVLSALVLAGALFGGFALYNKNRSPAVNTQEQVLSEQKANVAESTPSATEEKKENGIDLTLQRGSLVITVENGSGINGMAAKTQEYLEGQGYKVLTIDTADEQRDSTLLRFKKDRAQFKDLLSKDMAEKFPNIVVEDNLDEKSEYDLLVIIGTSVKL